MRRACAWLFGLLICSGLASAASGSFETAYRFLLAQLLVQDGAYSEALETYEALVAEAPQEPYVRMEYAELLFRLGRVSEAATQASEARRMRPADPEVLRLYGQIELRQAESRPAALARAREAFEDLRRIAPDELESMVTLGQIYLSENRMDDAIVLFSQLLERRPADRMLFSFLLEALQRSGRVAEGEAAIRRFVDYDPHFLKARLALAQLLSDRGDHAESVEVLAAATEAGFDGAEVLRQLAVERYRSGDAAGALEAAQRLLAEQPDDFGARYLSSLALVELGRRPEARVRLGELLAERPDNLDIGLVLARLLEEERRSAEAAEVLRQIAERLAEEDRLGLARTARLRLAEVLARAGEWEQVLAISEELLEDASKVDRVEASLLKAEALANLGRPERALEVLNGMSAEESPPSRIAAKRAELLFEMRRESEAREALASLTESDELEALLLAAAVFQELKYYDDAIPLLQRARSREPESPQLLFRLGAAYERNGQIVEAERSFRDLLGLEPDFAPALNYLGYMWAERGLNLPEAVDLVQRAVQLDPDNGAYIDSLGWAYFQMGRFQEARGHLERAAELAPDDAVVYEHLGDLYLAVGEVEEAQRIYERAVRLGGENQDEVRRKLRRLSDGI